MNTIVIRLSSLGDVVLAGSITENLAPVTFITKKQYHPIAKQLAGVTTVLSPDDPLPTQAKKVVDLQRNVTSRRLAKAINAPTFAVNKLRWQQWQRVIWKSKKSIATIPQRYAAAAQCEIANKPWITLPSKGKKLGICPGSQHKTKKWPAQYYSEIIKRWPHDVILFGSAEEHEELEAIKDQSKKMVTIVAEKGFEKTLQALQETHLVLGNDTGLVHLAAAMNISVLMLFGPTTSQDGFWCHDGTALELPLFCRPCSRYGGNACPIGDHACMKELTPEMVWQKAKEYLP